MDLTRRPIFVFGLLLGCALVATLPGGLRAAPPDGWFAGGPGVDGYEAARDGDVKREGKAPAPDSFLMLSQVFRSKDYRGKRVRFAGQVRTEKLDGEARLFMRVDTEDALHAIDNSGDRAVKGTTDWEKVEIVLDVPDADADIQIGVLASGKGTAWFDGLVVEVVGKDVKPTNAFERPSPYKERRPRTDVPANPTNLGFEAAPKGK
jgi:hypothetical protein